jgi:hypothetical protein
VDAGRISAGFAVRGFFAALDVARARQDTALFEKMQAVIESILRAFEAHGQAVYGERDRAYLTGDLEALAAMVERFEPTHPIERIERALSLLADRGRFPAVDALRGIGEFAHGHSYRILEAQALRAQGAAMADIALLTRALDLFEQAGAVPYVARTRCERALLTGDSENLAAGLRALETLGDFDYVSSVEQHARRFA